MAVKISKRVREEAAMLCALMSSSPLKDFQQSCDAVGIDCIGLVASALLSALFAVAALLVYLSCAREVEDWPRAIARPRWANALRGYW
jgi:hypothetical protein